MGLFKLAGFIFSCHCFCWTFLRGKSAALIVSFFGGEGAGGGGAVGGEGRGGANCRGKYSTAAILT